MTTSVKMSLIDSAAAREMLRLAGGNSESAKVVSQSPESNRYLARSSLVLDDFTTWIAEHSEEDGAPRLYLGNPPYTRASLLSLETRERLRDATDGLCGLRASLSTSITAMTIQRLSDGDGL